MLIGATTENPSFEVNSALLSRSKVFVLKPLEPATLVGVLRRALADRERGLGEHRRSTPTTMRWRHRQVCQRRRALALNMLETGRVGVGADGRPAVDARAWCADLAQRRALLYDKTGEEHYNVISALHKSLRNSDPDAALYWLARMLEAARTRSTSPGGWCASPRRTSATPTRGRSTVARGGQGRGALHRPAGGEHRAGAGGHLPGVAPKSNAVYARLQQTRRQTRRHRRAEPVPLHLRNAPTGLMKALDYGKGYQYAHDEPEGVADMECLPPAHAGRRSTGRPIAASRRRSSGWKAGNELIAAPPRHGTFEPLERFERFRTDTVRARCFSVRPGSSGTSPRAAGG